MMLLLGQDNCTEGHHTCQVNYLVSYLAILKPLPLRYHRHVLHGQLEQTLTPSKTPSKLQKQEHPGLLLGILDAAEREANRFQCVMFAVNALVIVRQAPVPGLGFVVLILRRSPPTAIFPQA